MSYLIPKYSFIKIFIPHSKHFHYNLGVPNIFYTVYTDSININKTNIKTQIMVSNDENIHIIKTTSQFLYEKQFIKENIIIKQIDDTFNIKYNLSRDHNIISDINIPTFKIEGNNCKLLLEYYKFVDNSLYNIYEKLKI